MHNNNNLQVLAGTSDFDSLKIINPFEIFAENVLEFWSELSSELLRHDSVKHFPDLISFAFFCRKTNLYALKNEHTSKFYRLGLGLAFHISPSNVAINFAYSLLSASLAGNASVIRLSSKDFEQVTIFIEVINRLFLNPKYNSIRERISVIRYEHSQELNSFFSSICDLRIVWGGDSTVDLMKQFKLQPKAKDISFPNRYSFSLINANSLHNNPEQVSKIAKQFYTDTYYFDQNACTSPKLVLWDNSLPHDQFEKVKSLFWFELHKLLDSYNVDAIRYVDKYLTVCSSSILNYTTATTSFKDNKLIVMQSISNNDLSSFECSFGLFFERNLISFDCLNDFVNSKYQTLTYFGYTKSELMNKICSLNLKGIDRIVPLGKASEFSLNWDGIDLINSMSRLVSVS